MPLVFDRCCFSPHAFLIIALSYTLCICFTLSSNDLPCLCPLPYQNTQQKLCLHRRVKGFKIEMKPAVEMGVQNRVTNISGPRQTEICLGISFVRGCDRLMRCVQPACCFEYKISSLQCPLDSPEYV